MTVQTSPIRRLFARFFPRKGVAGLPREAVEPLTDEQKKDLTLRYLAQGELSLLQGNLTALSYFEAASNLWPDNPQVWYRQGLSFFEYGSEEGKEKALLLAGKNFKIATGLDASFFDAWVGWGNVLLQLGRFHEEHHFHLEAKEKYQKALELSKNQPRETLAELYWDYGIVWIEIAKHSGEALDVKLAIEAFQTSAKYQDRPTPEFWNDAGKAYLEMGLLINDSRLYLQSIEHLLRAVKATPQYFDGWMSLAEAYSQLYINTMDQRYVFKASESFAAAAKLSPTNEEVWLSWAQLLGEVGRISHDPKFLRLSIEKCARAATLSPKDVEIISQWVESLSLLGKVTNRLDLLIEAETKILRATEQYPDDANLWHAYGICLLSFASYYEDPDYFEMAIEKLQYGLSIDRSDPELWHVLGLVHMEYAKMVDNQDLIERSARFLTKAIDLKPSCPSLMFHTASSLLLYSAMFDEISSLEQAISLLETLIQNHKSAILSHPEWLYEYGRAIEWQGDFHNDEAGYLRAIEIYSHVLLIDPDFARVHERLALCYTQLGHMSCESEFYKKAIHYFRLAVRHDEENEVLWLDWGLCLIHLAHHTLDPHFMSQIYLDAEQKILRAGRLGNEGAYYNLACLYSIMDRQQESMELIQKALESKTLPTLEELLEDEWLDNLRSTEAFNKFIYALEVKMQQTREE